MKDKPKKYGFLEYALCTLNGYFLHVLVHHVPGKAKRVARKLNETNLATDLQRGTTQGIRCKKATFTGTQVMQNNKTKKPIWFVEYKNLPSSGWGRIAKYGHEWYCDNDQGISIIRFHDKKKITLISTEYHGCEVDEVPCTRNRRRSIVTIPKMVKFYSKKREELI